MKKIFQVILWVLIVIAAAGSILWGVNTLMNYRPKLEQKVVTETKQDMEKPSERVTIVITEPEKAPVVVPPAPEKPWKVREFMGECVLENREQGVTVSENGDITLKIKDEIFETFPSIFPETQIGFYNSEGKLIAKITSDFVIRYTGTNGDATQEHKFATVTINGSRSRIELFKNLAYIEVQGQKFSLEGSLEGWNDLQKCLTNKQ